MSSFGLPLIALFQSTPSARRATREERLRANLSQISIHALREEGDTTPRTSAACCNLFQSTPSARRATAERRDEVRPEKISIHALREEGDGWTIVYRTGRS